MFGLEVMSPQVLKPREGLCGWRPAAGEEGLSAVPPTFLSSETRSAVHTHGGQTHTAGRAAQQGTRLHPRSSMQVASRWSPSPCPAQGGAALVSGCGALGPSAAPAPPALVGERGLQKGRPRWGARMSWRPPRGSLETLPWDVRVGGAG